MSRSTRVIAAIVLTLLAVGAMAAYTISRARHWERIGITGIVYLPTPPEGKKPRKNPPPAPFGLRPGSVMLTSPLGPAEKAGIRAHDSIVSVNGIAVKDVDGLAALDRRLHTGDKVVYRVERDKKQRDIVVPLTSPLNNRWYILSAAVSGIVAAAFIAIGLLVFTRSPDDRRVTVFYAAVTVGALSLLGGPAFALDGSGLRGITAQQQALGPLLTLMIFAMALMPLTLHLALVFPRDRPVIVTSPQVIRWIYSVPILVILASIAAISLQQLLQRRGPDALDAIGKPINWFLGAAALIGMGTALFIARRTRGQRFTRALWERPILSIIVFYGILFGLLRVFAALKWKWLAAIAGALSTTIPFLAILSFPVLACTALYRSYRESGPEERRQVKWPLWAIIIAVVTKLFIVIGTQATVFVLLFSGRSTDSAMRVILPLQYLPTIVYLIIPISFAFAILKYRLMNIDVIIRKTVAYALLSGAIVILYLALVGGLGTVLVNVAGVKNQTMVIASTLVVALLVVPLRNKLQMLVDRNLFRHKYDYPEALKAIASETLAANDLNGFLASAAEKTQQALQNRAVVIFTTRHEELVAAAKVGVADSVLGALRVARTPLLPMLDRPFDPRKHALPEDTAAALRRIEAVLVVPVNTPGTPANGFIALAPKLSGGGFEIEDIDFLRSVADQLDMGIDRIRLQREEVDFEQARAIQQTLLPREMPRVEGLDVSGVWLPARTVGGDYFDVLRLGEHELAVCIGDVAGKGMSAALLMSGLQAAVRASASGSPRDLCERVRRVVVSSLTGGRFVTFFYATLDAASMTLRWCNAGHNAPILARADGTLVRLAEGGPAFSRLFRDDKYEERELALASGDRLVLFTDGVSEASAGDGEMLGEGRLEQLVLQHRDRGARELQQTLVETATDHTGGQLDDDLTLVVVAVRNTDVP